MGTMVGTRDTNSRCNLHEFNETLSRLETRDSLTRISDTFKHWEFPSIKYPKFWAYAYLNIVRKIQSLLSLAYRRCQSPFCDRNVFWWRERMRRTLMQFDWFHSCLPTRRSRPWCINYVLISDNVYNSTILRNFHWKEEKFIVKNCS